MASGQRVFAGGIDEAEYQSWAATEGKKFQELERIQSLDQVSKLFNTMASPIAFPGDAEDSSL